MLGPKAMDETAKPPESKSETEPVSRPKSKVLRRVFIASQVLLGVGVGLFVTEKVFAARDEGAFPHVNFYVADPELGVRLEPGASMKFRQAPNPLSHIAINSQGYRGEDWPAPGEHDDEIIVLGDSQVFGLGVEHEQTFSAQLAAQTGRPVLNAGVPTYGPPEYLALARELLAAREPETLVVTFNFLNDPFELGRPNNERHAVWDGWAVRAEFAPASVREFPGRRWLYSQSHAFYALRRWNHERGKSQAVVSGVDFGTPSEGGFGDLVGDSFEARVALAEAQVEAETELDSSRARLAAIEAERSAANDKLDDLLHEFTDYEFDTQDAKVARAQPGDIVEISYFESSRSLELSAALIRAAARERQRYLDRLLERKNNAKAEAAADLLETDAQLVAEREALRRKIAAGVPLLPPPPSLFGAYLDELAAVCAAHGTELVVVALPVDVQVDPAEWDKYGVDSRPDMSESLILLADFVANAEAKGIRALDVSEALRAASPGAFLDHDIHMSAQGHAAFAEALAARLDAPLPVTQPAPGLPETLAFVPERSRWRTAGEFGVTGSSKLGCRTLYEDGWLNVACRRRKKRDQFRHIEVVEGGGPTTMTVRNDDGLSLVTPLAPGQPLRARFEFRREVHELRLSWTEGQDGAAKLGGEFVELDDAEPREATQIPEIAALCECRKQVEPDGWVVERTDETYYDYDYLGRLGWDWEESCGGMWIDLALGEACREVHGEACSPELFSCMQHDPLFAPPCPEGTIHAFASNACFALCDEAHPCEAGSCAPWQGGGVCV